MVHIPTLRSAYILLPSRAMKVRRTKGDAPKTTVSSRRVADSFELGHFRETWHIEFAVRKTMEPTL
jgi:hypothetical protein